MRLGIDASNIRAGGGVTHLKELLHAADPKSFGISKVCIWSGKNTLEQLEEPDWLEKRHVDVLDGSQWGRIVWQRFSLPRLAAAEGCKLLFVPGGNYHGKGIPYVAMSQNLLPFDSVERRRFGISLARFRYYLLRRGQGSTFRNASGMIFLTETARRLVEMETGTLKAKTAIVPHGISVYFRRSPVQQPDRDLFPANDSFRWLYVSIVNLYKHQWNVVEAVARLREEGLHVALDMIGPAHPKALKRLKRSIDIWDRKGEFITYHGPVPHHQLPRYFHQASGFVFASSCENMPIILLEAMSAGLPIACSDRGPMPEVLQDAGSYFDPENVSSIMSALRQLYLERSTRAQCANKAYEYASGYTWKRCADETFSFLAAIAGKNIQPGVNKSDG
jgi:glycosyltransferase involved in cell wall biosynthesis